MNDIEKKVTPEENPEIEAMSDEVIDQTLVQIRPGQVVTGKVVQITEDEVCVNIGYKADGIVKKTDLSSTDVKIDDEIEVEVVKVNDGEGNVLLSQKNIINRKAWDEIVAKQEAGEFVEGIGKEAGPFFRTGLFPHQGAGILRKGFCEELFDESVGESYGTFVCFCNGFRVFFDFQSNPGCFKKIIQDRFSIPGAHLYSPMILIRTRFLLPPSNSP